jgi:hypothetical protein
MNVAKKQFLFIYLFYSLSSYLCEETRYFKMCYHQYELSRMPLDMIIEPIVFVDYMKKNFFPYLNKFMEVFIDDVLIYHENHENHAEHSGIMLKVIKEKRLFAKLAMMCLAFVIFEVPS